jgi:hypothetical protein
MAAECTLFKPASPPHGLKLTQGEKIRGKAPNRPLYFSDSPKSCKTVSNTSSIAADPKHKKSGQGNRPTRILSKSELTKNVNSPNH